MDDGAIQEARMVSNDLNNEATAAASSRNYVNLISSGNSAHHNITNSNIAAMSQGQAVDFPAPPGSSTQTLPASGAGASSMMAAAANAPSLSSLASNVANQAVSSATAL